MSESVPRGNRPAADAERADWIRWALHHGISPLVIEEEFDAALRAERLAVESELADAYRWVARQGPFSVDGACRECFPHGTALIEGFQCVPHKSRSFLDEVRVAGLTEERTPQHPGYGWHNDGDECIGPDCINPAHFEEPTDD